MTKSEILDFIKANPSCFLATVEGNKPRVRGMRIIRAGDDGIIFQLQSYKDLARQLTASPEAEACFHDEKKAVTVRVSGRMELVKDLELKKEILAKRPFLKAGVDKEGWDYMVVYRLKNGRATVWSQKDMMAPKTYIDL